MSLILEASFKREPEFAPLDGLTRWHPGKLLMRSGTLSWSGYGSGKPQIAAKRLCWYGNESEHNLEYNLEHICWLTSVWTGLRLI